MASCSERRGVCGSQPRSYATALKYQMRPRPPAGQAQLRPQGGNSRPIVGQPVPVAAAGGGPRNVTMASMALGPAGAVACPHEEPDFATTLSRLYLSFLSVATVCDNCRPGSYHCHHAYCCSATGTEADAGICGGVGGTVASESALRSAGTLLSRVRAPPPVPWPDGGPESLRSPCCGLAIYKNQTYQDLCVCARVLYPKSCGMYKI
ncbi:hypothetical protein PoB_006650600 [Plakobranchus ocellatus]|uniref:Uncharacterized protein n=1 Tax=Plakobranchus ocellatus TaxID=259542 RepID=A0AAV4D766_9GAST|nr:hypothetical protein PoB_006650600 [Plakobranchus ocellatus]